MKKIIILISLFILTGCNNNLINKGTERIESDIYNVISYNIKATTAYGMGFMYYKPRDFSLISDKENNHILLNKGYKYYLNVDINAYYNKMKSTYQIDDTLYYSNKFNYNDLDGYIEIKSLKNSYIYIKMMYNYSYVEVKVLESDMNEAVISSIIILSSIKYNDNVISSIIGSSTTSGLETTYKLKEPINKEENKNILDVYESDKYTE